MLQRTFCELLHIPFENTGDELEKLINDLYEYVWVDVIRTNALAAQMEYLPEQILLDEDDLEYRICINDNDNTYTIEARQLKTEDDSINIPESERFTFFRKKKNSRTFEQITARDEIDSLLYLSKQSNNDIDQID